MKELNYYFKTLLYGGKKIGIPSTLRDLVINKAKSSIAVDILVIVESEVMRLNWNEIEFLAYETTSGKYSNYQHGGYQILWMDFVPNVEGVPKGMDKDVWALELALLNRVHYSFYNPLRKFFVGSYKDSIVLPLMAERKAKVIYPDQQDLLKSFTEMDLNKIRVVFLGHDPYPAGNHATGLAFATKQKDKPASLIEIEKAIKRDYPQLEGDIDTSMTHLVKQGVFLLNSSLSVREREPNSHTELWKPFIDLVMQIILLREKRLVFVLMGSEAKRYKQLVESTNHTCICVEHPAAALYQKREWAHNNLFIEVDKQLEENKTSTIKWLRI